MCYSTLDGVATTGLHPNRELPSEDPEKEVISTVTRTFFKKKKREEYRHTCTLQFSVKIVNYCADEFHSFVKET